MESQKVVFELVTIIRERLARYSQVAISELGIFKVISKPSESKSLNADKFSVHPPKKEIVLESNPSTPTDTTLISGLASTLGISHEASEKTITIFSKEILSQLPVTIPELGTFKKSNDQLQFTADTKLNNHIVGIYSELTPVEIDKTTVPAQNIKRTSFPTTEQRSPWAAILIPMVVILAIVGYFLLQGITGNNEQESSESITLVTDSIETVVSEEDEIPSDELETSVNETDQSEAPSSVSDTPQNENLSTTEPPQTSQSESSLAPVNLLDRESGGYTLIIGSFNTPAQAMSVVERYRTIYPTLPVDTLIGTGNQHRIAIGQVSTIPEALALKESLSEIPEDSWVYIIRN
ncbi:MAG: SPOR domain-containing protein [Bacteroidetes bacterium]|nr:SPOR domain-containing protein [Bacteroidota bacterium]